MVSVHTTIISLTAPTALTIKMASALKAHAMIHARMSSALLQMSVKWLALAHTDLARRLHTRLMEWRVV